MQDHVLLIVGLLIMPFAADAQLKLDVDGTARINGRLELGAPGNSLFIGTNAGIADDGTDNDNTFIGIEAGVLNTIGSRNIFLGKNAGHSNTEGGDNIFIGVDAGLSNTTGTSNTFVGRSAGNLNTTGGSNTFLGRSAGTSNTMGALNTFVGYSAGYTNTIGSRNTFLGLNSGRNNTEGADNTFLGHFSGFNNTLGGSNTFVGNYTGFNNTTGGGNTFLGRNAGGSNTMGGSNTFLGSFAGSSNTIGSCNTFLGLQSGTSNTEGKDNTFLGCFSGFNNTTGVSNTFVGDSAGKDNTIGIERTALGHDANSLGTDYDNSTGLGFDADPTSANIIHVGNTSVSSIKGQVGFTTYSDGRFKENVRRDAVPGLSFIQALEPVTYKVSVDAFAKWKAAAYGEKDTLHWRGKYDVEEIRFTGFIAQEVEAAAQKIGYDFSGVDKPANDKSFYGLRYATFVVPLVQGMQEQQEIIEEQADAIGDLASEISRVKSENEQLRDRLSRLESLVEELLGEEETDGQSVRLSSVRLDQNEPNPFTGATRIGYYLPAEISGKAELIVTNAEGRELQRIALSSTGEGYVELDARQLTSGNYQYSLLLNGQIVATKRMVRVK